MQLWLIHADANSKVFFLPNQTLSMTFTGQKEESKGWGERRGQGWFLEAEPGY